MSTPDEPTRLMDVPAFLCRIRPSNAAPTVEWMEFYRRSSDLYKRVAQSDPDNYVAAMAVSCLDFDKAAEYREAMNNTPQ